MELGNVTSPHYQHAKDNTTEAASNISLSKQIFHYL